MRTLLRIEYKVLKIKYIQKEKKEDWSIDS